MQRSIKIQSPGLKTVSDPGLSQSYPHRRYSNEIPIPKSVENKAVDEYELEYHIRRVTMLRTIQKLIPLSDDDVEEDEYCSYGIGPAEVISLQRRREIQDGRYREMSPGLSEDNREELTESYSLQINGASTDQENQFDIEI